MGCLEKSSDGWGLCAPHSTVSITFQLSLHKLAGDPADSPYFADEKTEAERTGSISRVRRGGLV